MKPCPECKSEEVYRYKSPIGSAGAYGPVLLPKLKSSIFSAAEFLPVVCGDCGLVRYYASAESTEILKDSVHWKKI